MLNQDAEFETYAENMKLKIRYRKDPAVLNDVCLFSSYNFSDKIEEYVYYYLQELQNAGFAIVFITTSELQESCVNRLSKFAFIIAERENKCPDFGSWKAGLILLDWGKKLNNVLMANDSVFGPFFNLGNIISSMKKRYDVWGMTDSYELDYHLQSYFLYFNKNVADSDTFKTFWKNIDLNASKDEVIHKYEVGLSGLFKNAKYRIGAYASVDVVRKNALNGNHVINPTVGYWKILIEQYQFPFFKREAIIKLNISRTYWYWDLYLNMGGWKKVIEKNTEYPVKHIEDFVNNYYKIIKKANDDIVLQKRKILFLINNAQNDEAQIYINLLRWLKKEADVESEIIICKNNNNNRSVFEFTQLGTVTNFYALSDEAKRDLKERVVDNTAVIFSNSCENIYVQQFFSFLDVPQIVFIYELPLSLKNILSVDGNTEWLKRNISQFIAGSLIVKQNFAAFMSIDESKIQLIHPFIDVENITTEIAEDEILPEMKIPSGAFIAGMYGEFEWENAADMLPVIATGICRAENNIHILWCGGEKNNKLFQQVESDLKKTALPDRVHFIEKNKNDYSFFSAADVIITASREAPFSISNLKSGLSGKPVICFKGSGGPAEYISSGTGHAVGYLDVEALSAKVLSYYNNPELLKTEKNNLPQIIKNKFATNMQAPKILNVINEYYDGDEKMFTENPMITFMVHIYYENSWEEIKNKLKYFDNGRNNFLFSISDACMVKNVIIEDIKKSFKNAFFIVTSNVGKDVGGKMALIDLYLLLDIQSPYIAFLHDKQSPHSIWGEEWKNDLFKIFEPENLKKIFALFKDPQVGLVGAQNQIINEYRSDTDTFRNNTQISKKLLSQFGIVHKNYDFLGGFIFWMRASVIKNFFEINNPILMRENLEAGNVLDLYGETLSHTWERMFSWITTHQGYTIKGI